MFGDYPKQFGVDGIIRQFQEAMQAQRAPFAQGQVDPYGGFFGDVSGPPTGGHMPGMGSDEAAAGAGGLGAPPGTAGAEMARGAPTTASVAPGLPGPGSSPLAPGRGSPMAGGFQGAPPYPALQPPEESGRA